MLIKEGGLTILTDPGAAPYVEAKLPTSNIDAVLITHEHPDHFHIESVKNILRNNPAAKIYTNSSVGKLLQAEGLSFELLEDGQSTAIKSIIIEGHGKDHSPIYEEYV
ncbi:MAG: hypothetical protein A3J48_00410 [Candidatus Doudnabacteria bacterium RIFCSPHIGHO2_02_FULL_46_11]|uniref:Metallo-beta-lactamase domain-containing protein n=1 Tax=Candidatus Doudnabacteria bacterium RIFCSPHIGHO2_02_FULL_46_11 TaxID=1817832 RepID=A0A1F5P4P3_9BACT|nr:MAG: hypothetical protein A3J48_00410 [Candidatus Doudnabacteria bacterium RIFCSPHIGHO2_02_FULL_46_11]